MNLNDLLCAHEGKTLEFKRNLDSPQGVLRSMVAFANTAGGTVIIGVEDGTRNVCGVADPLALEERLANLRFRSHRTPDCAGYRNSVMAANHRCILITPQCRVTLRVARQSSSIIDINECSP